MYKYFFSFSFHHLIYIEHEHIYWEIQINSQLRKTHIFLTRFF